MSIIRVIKKIYLKTKAVGNVLLDELDKREIVFGNEQKSIFVKDNDSNPKLYRYSPVDDDSEHQFRTLSSYKIHQLLQTYSQFPANVTGIVNNEIPVGLKDGDNIKFKTANIFRFGTIKVFVNGLRLRKNEDFFVYFDKPGEIYLSEPIYPEDNIYVDYYTDDADFIPVIEEIPSGNIDGINFTYRTSGIFVEKTLTIYLNGLRLIKNEHYHITSPNEFALVEPPMPDDGTNIIVDYYTTGTFSTDVMPFVVDGGELV